MAGDLRIEEHLSVIAPGELGVARAPGPPVLHEYGQRVRINLAPPPKKIRRAPINPATLSETERSGLDALKLRESKQYIENKDKRPFAEAAWAKGPKPLHLDEQAIVGPLARRMDASPPSGGAGGSSRPGGATSAAVSAARLLRSGA